jgi:hypothetical protein
MPVLHQAFGKIKLKPQRPLHELSRGFLTPGKLGANLYRWLREAAAHSSAGFCPRRSPGLVDLDLGWKRGLLKRDRVRDVNDIPEGRELVTPCAGVAHTLLRRRPQLAWDPAQGFIMSHSKIVFFQDWTFKKSFKCFHTTVRTCFIKRSEGRN